jgi:hypothetical protein
MNLFNILLIRAKHSRVVHTSFFYSQKSQVVHQIFRFDVLFLKRKLTARNLDYLKPNS